MSNFEARYKQVKQRVMEAAARGGRDPSAIIIVAVSKTASPEQISEAFQFGVRDFGENRAQQLSIRQEMFPEAHWHLIGRLQTNKAKEVIDRACLIHSLDRWQLAEYIEKRAAGFDIKVSALLQVNVSGEASKGGVAVSETEEFLDSLHSFKHLEILGLMTMAPEVENPESVRPVFKELKRLYDILQGKNYANVDMRYLSMGMTQDFEVAIEEGANIVRIGRALFPREENETGGIA
ncbi:MAG: YggS family pyridoxal phosphate-dependent enzyme [Chitinophagales bacterium]